MPQPKRHFPKGAWTLVLLLVIVGVLVLTNELFTQSFRSTVTVTLTSSRTGLVLEPGGKVKMRGVQVGRVARVTGGGEAAQLTLLIDTDEVPFIPANVEARIRATTAFGAKYVDLIYPEHPVRQRLTAGQVLTSQNVTTEVNTVFQNLTAVLRQVDPAKLNSVLSALADGLRGQGPAIGRATTAANHILLELNSRSETIKADWRAFAGVTDTYGAAVGHMMAILDAASATSQTITANARSLDALLVNVIGLANSGIGLLAPNANTLVNAVTTAQPTIDLLLKYNPEYTCMLVGAKWMLDHGGYDFAGGSNGSSVLVDAGILFGDDPYRYPDNLPIVAAKGGPGGAPGCGSLPIADNNWPVRQLVTNTGFGTGLDWRPNPGIGHPFYADYLPVTRGTPQAPTVQGQLPGPAIGPAPNPGAPAYGAPLYNPDGTPLYPGLPPGVPSDTPPPDPAAVPPGAEPFQPPVPAQVRPTPGPPPP
ncbi:MCE family protein [Mycobacterium vicinigordonae]|uniref:MCE family protein n=1 Tax=Mycobacterium vicinigordonae TaxID=1719132 RepID=A0A7D6HSJ3_9MYCO|nr:MCE family protein [Mycobacterium vicinigordonae]QLL06372.1 MCE family protein [Mycobacterium vicinigordonae]